jgi:hypothetical protein
MFLKDKTIDGWTLAWGQIDGVRLCNRAAQGIALWLREYPAKQHHRLELPLDA